MNRFFIGLTDIASFIDDWDDGFKRNGVSTLKGSLELQSVFQNSNLDFIVKKSSDRIALRIPWFISKSARARSWVQKRTFSYYFKKSISECDVFIFLWNSFYTDFSDYKILKDRGKKIVTIFVGDEIRWQPALRQELESFGMPVFEYENYDWSVKALNSRLNHLRVAEKYSDLILSQPNITQLSLRPYHNLHIPIIAKKFNHASIQRTKPIIVHAPTSFGKGTKYIEPIIERLTMEGFNFEYKRIQNVRREDALKIYEDADIILDQILLPGGGKLAYECLAMGKIVLSLMGYEKYDQKKPDDCPIIDIRKETLYDVLCDLIPNQIKRQKIALKGRPYIEKYHDPAAITARVINYLDYTKVMDPDFYPTFYRDAFIPESAEHVNIYNKWNGYVLDCEWYKKYVARGERSGLNF